MALFFPAEFETSVFGDDGGVICFVQTTPDGEESMIFLTIRQFQEIWNHEKSLIESARASK